MTAPAPPKATQGQGELKRAPLRLELLHIINDNAGFPVEILNRLLPRLAAGSPEVIVAMQRVLGAAGFDVSATTVSAALAAGMKVIAEGGK